MDAGSQRYSETCICDTGSALSFAGVLRVKHVKTLRKKFTKYMRYVVEQIMNEIDVREQFNFAWEISEGFMEDG